MHECMRARSYSPQHSSAHTLVHSTSILRMRMCTYNAYYSYSTRLPSLDLQCKRCWSFVMRSIWRLQPRNFLSQSPGQPICPRAGEKGENAYYVLQDCNADAKNTSQRPIFKHFVMPFVAIRVITRDWMFKNLASAEASYLNSYISCELGENLRVITNLAAKGASTAHEHCCLTLKCQTFG